MIKVKVGDVFQKWTVISGPMSKRNRIKHWVCRCVCGAVKEVSQYSLLNDRSKSCGCVREVSEKTRKLLSDRRRHQPPPRPAGRKGSGGIVCPLLLVQDSSVNADTL